MSYDILTQERLNAIFNNCIAKLKNISTLPYNDVIQNAIEIGNKLPNNEVIQKHIETSQNLKRKTLQLHSSINTYKQHKNKSEYKQIQDRILGIELLEKENTKKLCEALRNHSVVKHDILKIKNDIKDLIDIMALGQNDWNEYYDKKLLENNEFKENNNSDDKDGDCDREKDENMYGGVINHDLFTTIQEKYNNVLYIENELSVSIKTMKQVCAEENDVHQTKANALKSDISAMTSELQHLKKGIELDYYKSFVFSNIDSIELLNKQKEVELRDEIGMINFSILISPQGSKIFVFLHSKRNWKTTWQRKA